MGLLQTDYHKAQITLWAREVTQPVVEELVDTVSDAWAYSALNSLRSYNEILSFGGEARAIAPVPETLEQLQRLAGGRPFKNKSLAEMVDSVFSGGIGGALVETIDKGMNEGLSYKKIVDKVVKEAIPQGKQISERDAITVTRSYVQQGAVNAQLATYWLNRKIIKGVEWCAILDNRVCIKCAALDGTKYLWEDEKPPLIAHPRCRCLWLPIVKSYREMGLDRDDLKRAERNWVVREDGNVDTGGRKILDAGTTGDDFGAWWKRLPYEQQIKSVGPVRTRLINDGKLNFSDLVDKKTGKVFTLGELGFTEGGERLNKYGEAMEWIKSKVKGIRDGAYQPKGEMVDVGEIGSNVINSLEKEGIKIDSNKIIIRDTGIRHALRDAKPDKIPVEMWERLPILLSKPEGIYLNVKNNALVYEVKNEDVRAQIIVQPNYQTKVKKETDKKIERTSITVNNVRTGKVIKSNKDLLNRGVYKRLK